MKNYEIIREIFNGCAGKFMVDNTFFKEVSTDSPEEELKKIYGGKHIEYEKTENSDGSTVFTLHAPDRVRYTFSE